MTIQDTKIIEDVRQYDRVLAISIKAVFDQRDQLQRENTELRAQLAQMKAKQEAKA